LSALFRYFESLMDPIAEAPVVRPPDRVGAFYGHFLKPLRGLLGATLAVSLVAALSELAFYAFIGMLVDWAMKTPPEAFLATYGWALAGMALVVVIIRPAAMLASRGLINLALVPGLTSLVQWHSHRYVLRQSVSFFQNDFAGRIAQKVLRTGRALRESVVNIVDGVWVLIIYLIGTIVLFAGLDWRLLVPVCLWIVAYIVTIAKLVPGVRERSARMSEANSGLSGRIVDSYTNIQPVKLFAHGEREDAFTLEGVKRHLSASRALMRSILFMTVMLTAMNGVLIFATIAIALYLWMNGAISVGAIALTAGLIIRLNQMSGWILRTITSLFENIGTVEWPSPPARSGLKMCAFITVARPG
jgi:ATP-binding cassette subfamily B multidrug efflux pump